MNRIAASAVDDVEVGLVAEEQCRDVVVAGMSDGGVERRRAVFVLQVGMRPEDEEEADDLLEPPVDGQMQRRLLPLVARVDVDGGNDVEGDKRTNLRRCCC